MLCCDARPLAELQETPADSLEIPEVHDLVVLEDSYSNVVIALLLKWQLFSMM